MYCKEISQDAADHFVFIAKKKESSKQKPIEKLSRQREKQIHFAK